MNGTVRWWQKAVAYQVYPKSFYDSNKDGIGDLKGIIKKLPYLKELGIDLLYLGPVFASPMKDNGYDVSDYYKIEPLFGTNDDMDELLTRAKKMGIRIIMDMVINHCSDQHEWFQKAKKDPEGRYGKYFYFQKGQGHLPPNNWRSIFGGSAWEKLPGSEYYYLHVFTKEQVDLNWENPEVRKEIYRIMNFWMDKGVSGFRLDAVAYMKKKEKFPSFPADGTDGLVSIKYGTLNQPGLDVYLKEMRDNTYGKKDCFIVGEMEDAEAWNVQNYISLKNGYFNAIFETAHTCIDRLPPNYFWYQKRAWTSEELKDKWFESQKILCPDCWIANAIENHDSPRCLDWMLPKEGQNFYGASMLAVLYFFLWGTPFIYQGQEIGMRNFPLPDIRKYDDCSTYSQYKIAIEAGLNEEQALKCVQERSRDNARFPMLWTGGKNAGFTDGIPWMPIPSDENNINVEFQQRNRDSLFMFYKEMIELKKKEKALWTGKIAPMFLGCSGIFAYARIWENEKILVICNYQNKICDIPYNGDGCMLLCNYKKYKVNNEDGKMQLQPWQAIILKE